HQVRLLGEQLEDLVEGGHPGLVRRIQLGELLDRVEERLEVEDERGQDADRHAVPVDDLVAAVQEDRRGGERRQQLDAGEVRGVQVDGLHVRDTVGVV